jgi:hypothetical protein
MSLESDQPQEPDKPQKAKKPRLEPLTVTVADARDLSGLSNASVYGLINAGLVETTVCMGRRLIVYASLKAALGIRPDGAPPPSPGLPDGPDMAPRAAPGLTGGSIRRSPGRHRKSAAEPVRTGAEQ